MIASMTVHVVTVHVVTVQNERLNNINSTMLYNHLTVCAMRLSKQWAML